MILNYHRNLWSCQYWNHHWWCWPAVWSDHQKDVDLLIECSRKYIQQKICPQLLSKQLRFTSTALFKTTLMHVPITTTISTIKITKKSPSSQYHHIILTITTSPLIIDHHHQSSSSSSLSSIIITTIIITIVTTIYLATYHFTFWSKHLWCNPSISAYCTRLRSEWVTTVSQFLTETKIWQHCLYFTFCIRFWDKNIVRFYITMNWNVEYIDVDTKSLLWTH